ncbi:MAG: hypothetical protein L7S63_09575 [Flavobacteriales bacterium]|nr:hypothetical protein [Flavobacteriales bacterium]
MLRSSIALLIVLASICAANAQTDPVAFGRSASEFEPTSTPTAGLRSAGEGRFGFYAIFELRIAPGIVKTLDVRQFFGSELQSVEGFTRVRSSVPDNAYLVSVQWFYPTLGDINIGQ